MKLLDKQKYKERQKWPEFDFVDHVKQFFSIQAFEPDIIKWAETNINYSDDVSAQRNTPDFTQYPYQIDIIRNWADLDNRKIVTVVSCEQMRLRARHG